MIARRIAIPDVQVSSVVFLIKLIIHKMKSLVQIHQQ